RDHQYSIGEQANIAEHVLSTCGVTEFHVLAHDYGDTVAQELLAREIDHDTSSSRPYRVKSVVFLNGGLFPSTHRPIWAQHLLRMPVVASIIARFANRWMFGNSLNQVFGENQLTSLDIKELWYFARYKDGYRAWPGLLSYIDERQRLETRWTNALQRAKIPLCVFYGPADPVNPPPYFAHHYKKVIPQPCIETFPDTVGHYPQLENPEALMERYVQFLISHAKIDIDETQVKVVVPEKIPIPHPITE
ncbi:mesoderm-specific transcript protein-like, partial [Tropilaelaps mercedesae]